MHAEGRLAPRRVNRRVAALLWFFTSDLDIGADAPAGAEPNPNRLAELLALLETSVRGSGRGMGRSAA